MTDESSNTPTERELEILKILWARGEASVRDVYEEVSRTAPVVQNTVQSFLRTMEEKGLVCHRIEGRTFIYRPLVERERTAQGLVSRLLHRVFDGALDQMVRSALALRRPSADELVRLEKLIAEAKAADEAEGRGP